MNTFTARTILLSLFIFTVLLFTTGSGVRRGFVGIRLTIGAIILLIAAIRHGTIATIVYIFMCTITIMRAAVIVTPLRFVPVLRV